MKGYTEVEQSKKLLKLGLPADSADMFWSPTYCNDKKAGYFKKPFYLDEGEKVDWKKTDALPCWSFHRLLNIILWQDYDFNFFGCPNTESMELVYGFLTMKLEDGYFMNFDQISY